MLSYDIECAFQGSLIFVVLVKLFKLEGRAETDADARRAENFAGRHGVKPDGNPVLGLNTGAGGISQRR